MDRSGIRMKIRLDGTFEVGAGGGDGDKEDEGLIGAVGRRLDLGLDFETGLVPSWPFKASPIMRMCSLRSEMDVSRDLIISLIPKTR